MSFYIFFVYIKVFKNLLAKKIKIIKKKFVKDIKIFLKKEKKKSNYMVVNVTKNLSLKMKNNSLLSTEKNIIE